MKQQQKAKQRKAKQPRKQKEPPPKPRHKWQTGVFSRTQEVPLVLPYQFLLLCKLVQVAPLRMFRDFMANVSGDSCDRTKDEAQRSKAVEYFIQCNYGQNFYTEAEIRQMLNDLDAIGSLWPDGAKMKLIGQHAKWRDKYHDYWFKKWYRKTRRKL